MQEGMFELETYLILCITLNAEYLNAHFLLTLLHMQHMTMFYEIDKNHSYILQS